MSNKFIELKYEQIDAIVIDELQESYQTNYLEIDPSNRDQKLLDAIETVLGYYMTGSDFFDWKRKYDEPH